MHLRTSTVYNVTMVNYISFGSQLHVESNAVKIPFTPLNQKNFTVVSVILDENIAI